MTEIKPVRKSAQSKQPRVYLVGASHGCYEAHQEITLCAYLSEAAALAEKERLSKLVD